MSSSILHKFIEEDLINEEMLAKAKQIQALNKSGLGFNLALLGANEELLTKKLASYYGIEYIIDLLSIEFDSKVLTLITREKAESMCILSFKKSGKNVLIAVADPIHPELTSFLKELKMLKGIDAEIVIAPKSYIKLAIEQVIPKEQKSRVAEIIKDIAGKDVDLEIVKEQQIQEDIEAVDEAPVIKLCNSLISDAVEKMASDIHIEPFEKEIKIRYRINGTLVEQSSPPVKYKRTIDSRFKVMAKLDIIVKRKPQDERIKIKVKDKMIDLKFSTLPVVWDEKIVMRILDNSNLQLDLTKLGFEPDDLVKFQKAINSTYGIILVTGPNGSDKTTTLYSALSTINSPDINIMTVEVPAEYNLPNINQVQINPKADFTFVNALRAFLRQYPDVIMVGEIRDQETAEIAIKASFTRHLVISTLHINDASTTISRLQDMGIELFYIGASVIMIVAQRLMRKVCIDCVKLISYDESILKKMGIPQYLNSNYKFLKGQGCSSWNNSGYKGRIVIYELIEINEELKKSIMHDADSTVLKEISLKNSMKTLRQSAILNMCAGLTTLDEVLSVLRGES